MRDRDDAGAADEPDGRLDRDEPVLAGGRQQRARGLGADRRRRQPGRDRCRRPRARSARRDGRHAALVELRCVGIADLTTERAVPGRHVDSQDVGEFGQVGLAENDRTRLPQQGHDRGVMSGPRLGERERASSRVLRVGGGDVVLDEDWDAFERPADGRLARIARRRDRQRLGVDLAHGIEARAGAVIGRDPRQIGSDQGRGRGDAGRECLPQIADRCVLDRQIWHDRKLTPL